MRPPSCSRPTPAGRYSTRAPSCSTASPTTLWRRAAAIRGDPDTAARLRDRALATYERLGARGWQRRLAGWTLPGARGTSAGPHRMRLHATTDGLWLVGPADAAVPVRALRGFTYLRELLQRPGEPATALDLVTGGHGIVQSGIGELLDRPALDAYRQRLRDIEHDRAEAEDWADLGRLERLTAERDALLRELAGATGLGGRARTTSGSSNERARVAATKAINTAIDRIATVHQSTGEYLRVTIHTGHRCTYEPPRDDAPQWILD